MTEKQVLEMLKETKVATYRGHAPVGTKVPYMVLNVSYPDNFGADDVTYLKIPRYTVELYQTTPNQTIRETIENKLTENGFFFTEDEADMEEQNLFLTYYFFGGIK